MTSRMMRISAPTPMYIWCPSFRAVLGLGLRYPAQDERKRVTTFSSDAAQGVVRVLQARMNLDPGDLVVAELHEISEKAFGLEAAGATGGRDLTLRDHAPIDRNDRPQLE